MSYNLFTPVPTNHLSSLEFSTFTNSSEINLPEHTAQGTFTNISLEENLAVGLLS